MGRLGWLGLVLASLLLLAACAGVANTPGGSGNIAIKDGWVRSAALLPEGEESGDAGGHMGGSTSAAYMTIVNAGGSPDRLLEVDSDVAESVELHQTVMEGDVMSMSPVEAVDVPANGQAELKPGGYHVMLMGLKKDLVQGEKVKLTLTFEQAGALDVELEIRVP